MTWCCSKPPRNNEPTLTKGGSLDLSIGVVRRGYQSGVGVLPRNERSLKSARVSEWLSASKFPFRHLILHGLFLELRSFLYRIQLLLQRGGTRPLEIGLVYQRSCLAPYYEL